MRSPSFLVLPIVFFCASTQFAAAADEPAKTEAPAEQKPAAAEPANETEPANAPSAAEQAVRKAAADFSAAFNSGDAEKVAALWTADAEYIDEEGHRYQGRDTIKKEYETFFAANPKSKIRNTIDSIHIAGDSTAIEDGRETIDPPPVGAPGSSRYTAVYVLQDGKWLLSSVHDMRLPTFSNYHQLSDFDWLVGTWQGEKGSVKLESKCRWLGNKSFIERSYEVTDAGVPVSSGKQIIGWDPGQQQVHSWTFSSDAGHSESIWIPHANGWWTQSQGVLGDGTRTTAVIVLKKVDDDTLIWNSTDRTVGNVRLPNLDEVVLKRVVEKQ